MRKYLIIATLVLAASSFPVGPAEASCWGCIGWKCKNVTEGRKNCTATQSCSGLFCWWDCETSGDNCTSSTGCTPGTAGCMPTEENRSSLTCDPSEAGCAILLDLAPPPPVPESTCA